MGEDPDVMTASPVDQSSLGGSFESSLRCVAIYNFVPIVTKCRHYSAHQEIHERGYVGEWYSGASRRRLIYGGLMGLKAQRPFLEEGCKGCKGCKLDLLRLWKGDLCTG